MKFNPKSGIGDKTELIPAGTLAKAVVTVNQIKQSQSTGGQYMQIELTLSSGQYANRKIWDMVCDPTDERNSENWRKMGLLALTRAFEAAGIFVPSKPETYDTLEGKSFEEIARTLDGCEVAVKVKIEKSPDPAHADKNKVGEWLTPNKESTGHVGWKKMMAEIDDSVGPAERVHMFKPAGNPSSGTTPSWMNKNHKGGSPF